MRSSLKQARCTTHRPRHCELQVAATRVEDLAKEARVPAPELRRLFREGIEEGPAGERQVIDAIRATIGRMDGPPRDAAEQALRFLERTAAKSAG